MLPQTAERNHCGPIEVAFSAGTIRFDRESGVVHIAFAPATHINAAIAREEIAALKRLTGGKRRPVLCDFGNVASADLAARAYFGGQETRSAYSAVAFLTRSPMTRAIGKGTGSRIERRPVSRFTISISSRKV